MQQVATSGREKIYLCPFCLERHGSADTKGHLYVNDAKGVYICFRCDAKGKVAQLGLEELPTQAGSTLLEKVRDVLQSSQERFKIQAPDDDPVQLPEGLSRKLTAPARTYLEVRGFSSDELVAKYGIMDWVRASRILIPCLDSAQRLRFWVARSYDGGEPRYLNPKGVPKGRALFGGERLPTLKRVVVCEGAFSAMAVGQDAIALLGKTATVGQKLALNSTRAREFIIALEYDAKEQALDLARWLSYTHPNVKIKLASFPPGKDPADVGGLKGATLYDDLDIQNVIRYLHDSGEADDGTRAEGASP